MKQTALMATTVLLRNQGKLTEHQTLHRCPRTGIAYVADGCTGIAHSCHPNIHASGSVRGMKERGYWDKNAKTAKTRGFIYNISSFVVSDDLDKIAALFCSCGGHHNYDWE